MAQDVEISAVLTAPPMPHDPAVEAFGLRLRAARAYIRIVSVEAPPFASKPQERGRVQVQEVRAKRREPGVEPTGRAGYLSIDRGTLAHYDRLAARSSCIMIEAGKVCWDDHGKESEDGRSDRTGR